MRYLLLFMLLVGIFVLGKRFLSFSFFGLSGKGPIKTEIREVPRFHALEANLAGNVQFFVSDVFKVEVQAQENLLPHLKTEVSNGELSLFFDTNVMNSQGVEVKVWAPSLDLLSLQGSGNITSEDSIKASKLALNLGGSGNIQVKNLNCGVLDAVISGSGSIVVGGEANSLDASISGSGQIEGQNLRSDSSAASVSGSGFLDCGTVNKYLDASVSGSGQISYGGKPTTKIDISGSGGVHGR